MATTLSTVGTSEIIRSTVGSYYLDHVTTEAGDYEWWFRSTGNVTLSTGGRVAVKAAFATS